MDDRGSRRGKGKRPGAWSCDVDGDRWPKAGRACLYVLAEYSITGRRICREEEGGRVLFLVFNTGLVGCGDLVRAMMQNLKV